MKLPRLCDRGKIRSPRAEMDFRNEAVRQAVHAKSLGYLGRRSEDHILIRTHVSALSAFEGSSGSWSNLQMLPQGPTGLRCVNQRGFNPGWSVQTKDFDTAQLVSKGYPTDQHIREFLGQ